MIKTKSTINPDIFRINSDKIYLLDKSSILSEIIKKEPFGENGSCEQNEEINYMYDYNEYILPISNRDNLREYVDENYDMLLNFAKEYDDKLFLDSLREERKNAFEIIDKYQLALVFETLTDIQKDELKKYREDWLNVTKTRIIPEKLIWFK